MRTNSLRDTHTHTTYIFYTISDVSISQMLLQRRHLYNHKHTPRDKHIRYFVALFVQSRTKFFLYPSIGVYSISWSSNSNERFTNHQLTKWLKEMNDWNKNKHAVDIIIIQTTTKKHSFSHSHKHTQKWKQIQKEHNLLFIKLYTQIGQTCLNKVQFYNNLYIITIIDMM